MNSYRLVWALAILILLGATGSAVAEDSAWVQLFNGKDLKDWDFHIRTQPLNTDPNHTFKVQDGNLFVDYSEYTNFNNDPFGHIGYKLKPFSYYLLRSEYQFITGKQVTGGPGWALENNGFMLHSQAISTMGINQDFPISLEAQLLGPANGTSTMNLCTPGTHFHDMSGKLITDHCVNAISVPRFPAPAWTAVSALVLGDSLIKHMVGKDTVFKFTKPVTGGPMANNATVPIIENQPLKSGYIVLQAESAPILFRKIEILDLIGCMDKTSPAYRSYFVKNNSAACTVTGVSSHPQLTNADFQIIRSGEQVTVTGNGDMTVVVLNLRGEVLSRSSGKDRVDADLLVGKVGVQMIRIRTAIGTVTSKLPVL